MTHATAAIAPTDQSSSLQVADASSANDARQPETASQGRRAEHEGSCLCVTDDVGASSSGFLFHNHPRCAMFQAIVNSPDARAASLDIAARAIDEALRFYIEATRQNRSELSQRQTLAHIARIESLVDVIAIHARHMNLDTPSAPERGEPMMKGAES